jgi:DNA-3-methyladenine glycosylase
MESIPAGKKLPRSFYKRDVITVARQLLGKILVRVKGKHSLAGKIVEVEAYDGEIDEAAHTFIGQTERNKIMFGEGGFLYVYFTYGAHFCSNVVTGVKGKGTAVLIRALEPLAGIEQMGINRFNKKELTPKEKLNLTSGPGKICSALNIDRTLYGEDLTGNRIYILNAPPIPESNIASTKRIGIKKSIDLPWRFYIKDNPWVSRK